MKDPCLRLCDEEVVEAKAGVSGQVESYIFQANGYVGVISQANLQGIEGEVVIPDSEPDAEALLWFFFENVSFAIVDQPQVHKPKKSQPEIKQVEWCKSHGFKIEQQALCTSEGIAGESSDAVVVVDVDEFIVKPIETFGIIKVDELPELPAVAVYQVADVAEVGSEKPLL